MPLIVFEGVDGGGKTSQLKQVEQSLRDSGWNVSSGAFPTSDFRHRVSLLSDSHFLTTPELICLHMLDFIQHSPVPASPDHIVLLDRYYPSTAVYQSTPEIPPETILQMVSSFGLPSPDLCLLFMPPEKNISARLKSEDIFLLESRRWYDLRQQYLQLASADPARWVLIDTSPAFENVTARLMAVIQDHLLSHGLHPSFSPHSSSGHSLYPPDKVSPFKDIRLE